MNHTQKTHSGILFLLAASFFCITFSACDTTDLNELPATLPTNQDLRVTVTYNGPTATVSVPPTLQDSIATTIRGAHVVLRPQVTATEVIYILQGQSSNGSLLIKKGGNYKQTLLLSGLNLTNPDSAAIKLNCTKRVNIGLAEGTINTLADGNGEDDACLYCKGHLEFSGAGTLNITGNYAHAIKAKEYVEFKKSLGHILILSSQKDGIHCGEYFKMNGGTIRLGSNHMDATQRINKDAIQIENEIGSSKTSFITIKGGTLAIHVKNADRAFIADSLAVTPELVTINGQPYIPETEE